MKEKSTDTEIETLENQIKEIETLENQIKDKTAELDNAIEEGVIFEITRNLYLEMKALKERLGQYLHNKV